MKYIIEKLVEKGLFDNESSLNSSEIEELNENLEIELPLFFVEYLQTFGFNQTIFWTIFNDEEDFIEQNTLLQEMEYTDYIAIGDEYAENLLLVHITNQQLFLLEDDQLIDLKTTFSEMLQQTIDELEAPDLEKLQQVEKTYKRLKSQQNKLEKAFKESFEYLTIEANQQKDELYGLIISKNKLNYSYNLSAGSLNHLKKEIENDIIDYDKLWNPKGFTFQHTISIDETLLENNDKYTSLTIDLLFLDVLRDLKNERYFESQIENFSTSIQSFDVNFFPEDSFEESLTKKNTLSTKIHRFWESTYDRTRILIDTL